jgi:sugar phosphate isomerase/epimerase
MVNTTAPKDIDELWLLLRERLAGSQYAETYDAEPALEVEVWKRVVTLAVDLEIDVNNACLTSHAIHRDRSDDAWKLFREEPGGADVNVLGSNNRLDIVFRHRELGSIGIEVKWLGATGHAAKLTQGLGQALLGLENRGRTILLIHCGAVDVKERERLREVGDRICAGLRTGLVVVP